MPTRAGELRELLLSLSLQVREIRGLSLVDLQGLPMVSTLGAGALDEALAAFGGATGRAMERAQEDFKMGPLYLAHFVGRDRQVFVAPVNDWASLAALVEAQATPATITMHLLALARELSPHLESMAPPELSERHPPTPKED